MMQCLARPFLKPSPWLPMHHHFLFSCTLHKTCNFCKLVALILPLAWAVFRFCFFLGIPTIGSFFLSFHFLLCLLESHFDEAQFSRFLFLGCLTCLEYNNNFHPQ